MLGKQQWTPVKAVVSFLMAAVLVSSLVGCGNRAATSTTSSGSKGFFSTPSGQISEVSPPEVIQQLRPALEGYQPQVTILSPQTDEIIQDTTVSVQFQVQDLPIFQDASLGLGPHLHVILDNQPYEAVYDISQPLVLKDLSPGTHTLRAFASRPWHESFKNEGAYAQTTFHILTKTAENDPTPTKPLLTYSRPKGSYGAEPILLDFYLTNAPLHLVAQEKANDDIADWRIRVTINGESFVLDKWQPIYLKGFKPGKNWVQLEFLDEQGNLVDNVFNNTVRLITYEPKGKDTLSKLVRGELKAADVRGIVDPNAGKSPAVSPEPIVTPTPIPRVEEAPAPPVELPTQPEVEKIPSADPVPSAKELEQPKGGFFNRFRRPAVVPTPPEVTETPSAEPTAPETIPLPGELPQPEPSIIPTPAVEPEKPPVPVPAPKGLEKPTGGFFNRFRRPAELPKSVPTPPEVETSTPESAESETVTQPEASPQPEVTVTPTPEALPREFINPEPPKRGGFFNRPRRPELAVPTPSTLPTLPEVLETPSTAPQLEETPPATPAPVKPSQPQKPKFEPPSGVVSPLPPSSPPTLPEIIPSSTPTPAVGDTAVDQSKESSAEAQPKVDLKKLLVPQPTPSPSLRIIQAPADTDIPSSFLKKLSPTPPSESEASEKSTPEAPTAETPSEAESGS